MAPVSARAPTADRRGGFSTSSQLLLAAVLAAVLPTLLAFHQPPSATLLNQCLAVALWGAVVALIAPRWRLAGTGPLLMALLLLMAAALASTTWGTLPRSLAWEAAGLLAGASLLVLAGADAARGGRLDAVFSALAWALLAAGVLSACVALVQVFAPGWTDSPWLARSGLPGRAVGNLRQPNHLCSLLLWALIAAVALHELRRLPTMALAVLLPLLVLAVELSASRTGAVGLLLLLLWGALDRNLSRAARVALLATPLLYLVAWAAMAWWGELSQQALGAGARALAEGSAAVGAESPNARPNIWRNTLALLAANPWTGVGFGEFNFAWTLSEFANRPTAFFDHSHNLPLQLLVELGLPLGGTVLLLLAWALWRAARRAWRAQGATATAGRASLVMVLMIGLHSLVEYPLWYAYFLLPAALAFGGVLGLPDQPAAARAGQAGAGGRGAKLGQVAGLLMFAGGLLAAWDYQRVVVIYAPGQDTRPLATRIAQGQLSPLFAHHADYAAATNTTPPASTALGMTRATHVLLDSRLMMAWARHLHDSGRLDEARWVAQRLRDFRNPEAAEFFAPCADGDTRAFPCQPPQTRHDWRDLARLPAQAAPAAPRDQAPLPATQ